MAYQKPLCDCGKELVYWEERIYHVHTKINKNGRLSKCKDVQWSGNGAYDRLHCPECGNQYWFNMDSKGRFIRDEEFFN